MNRAFLQHLPRFFLLPLMAVATLLCGCGMVVTTSAGKSSAVATNSPQTGRTSYTSFGDSITCGYVAAGATTGPPFSIGDASCHTANAYPSYLASSLSLPLHNYGIPADQACDIWPRQIAPQGVSPTLDDAPLYTEMIGTNDANAKGAGAYEVNFSACQLAVLTWLGLPAESKVAANQAFTTGWVLGSSPTVGVYAWTNLPGRSLYFTVTSYGGPLYLWHTVSDQDAGTATIQVDGASAGSFATASSVPIATQNGTSNTVMAERLSGIAAGTHIVIVTDVSGDVAVVGVGTPPQTPAANHPIVLAGNVPAPEQGVGDYLLPADAAYTSDTASVVTTLQGDGLDIRFVSTAPYFTGASAEMTDIFHVTPLGASHLAEAFQAVGP